MRWRSEGLFSSASSTCLAVSPLQVQRIALIPAAAVVALTALLIFTTPKFNLYFTYLYGWQYALIALGMLLLTAKTTRSQIKRLFGESVKKSLKGGSAQ